MNRIKNNERAKKYRAAHPERIKEAQSRYYRKNRERLIAAHQERIAKNPETYRRRMRAWLGQPEPTRPMPEACECCGRPQRGRTNVLHLDHNHQTGAFRGWLCDRCNRGLGMLGDSLEGVRRMVSYLTQFR